MEGCSDLILLQKHKMRGILFADKTIIVDPKNTLDGIDTPAWAFVTAAKIKISVIVYGALKCSKLNE